MFGLTEFLALAVVGLTIAYLWIRNHFSYWKRQGVPYIQPNFIFGNIKDMIMMKSSAALILTDLYNDKIAQNEPFVGIHVFHQPALLLRNLDLIKLVLIKDFNKFSNRFTSADAHGDVLGANNLFVIKNPGWRQLRTKLTPVFSSGKIKQMFGLIDTVGKQLDHHLSSSPLTNQDSKSVCLELKNICALYTTDVIASIAFGINANSFKNPDGDFRTNGKRIFTFTTWRSVEFTSLFFLPQLVPIINARFFSTATTKFMKSTINHAMEERLKSGTTRNDLIDVLISMQKSSEASPSGDSDFKMTNDVLVAQAAVFFTAGFETSSGAMAFGLYELSKKPEMLKRLRAEIHESLAQNNGELTYDSIQSMEYLNMVVQEVLRLYPTLPFLDRVCTLAEGEKSYSLQPFGNFDVPNGMPVYISIFAIQRDPQYFPDPNAFDPERFSPENRGNIVPGSYMPFGIGPHNCIGERFGILQAKMGFIHFLKNHYVRQCDRSMAEMILDPKALLLQGEGGIYCDVIRDPFK